MLDCLAVFKGQMHGQNTISAEFLALEPLMAEAIAQTYIAEYNHQFETEYALAYIDTNNTITKERTRLVGNSTLEDCAADIEDSLDEFLEATDRCYDDSISFAKSENEKYITIVFNDNSAVCDINNLQAFIESKETYISLENLIDDLEEE